MNGHRKRTGFTAGGMAAVLSCALLFSCNNDDFLENNEHNSGKACDHICFGITSDENVRTRGISSDSDNGYTAERFVLRSQDSADTLCVRAIVSDGIHSSEFRDKQVVTRSNPVYKDDFYNSFRVQAHCTDGGTLLSTFYMDDEVTNFNDGVWSTDNVYYWPGENRTLRFFAWAPSDAVFASVPENSASTELSYTVPEEATAQKDIVVAVTDEKDGNLNQAVSLTFDHICTAVRFVTGSQMQPGTIESVSLEGVQYSGSYDMSAKTWALVEETMSFSQGLNKSMSGEETDGTDITTAEGTFMMLPQTLPNGAKVKVVFNDKVAGKTRTLEASIAGKEWPKGKTVTYKLSITPDYDMSIECVDKIDAHVDIQEIHITADGPWVLNSNVEWLTFTDWSYDESKPEERPLGHRGYWIRSERGGKTFSGTGNKTLYAYYDEHLGDQSREAKMTLTYPDNPTIVGAQKVVTQYCPAWSGTAGYERFEEDHRWEEDGSPTFTYPFGFAWNRKVTFTATPKFTGNPSWQDVFGAIVFEYIANNMIRQYDASAYVTVKVDYHFIFPIRTTVTIDYSNFNAIGDLVTPDDGLANTRNLYGFKNIGQISAIENILRDNAVGDFKEESTDDNHDNILIDQFAVRRIAMKNEFRKEIRTIEQNEQTVRYAEAVIDINDIHWYLPASDEQDNLKSGLTEGDEPLEGEYWSSTAIGNNVNAYKYSPDGNLTAEDRMIPHKMRAAVRK